MTFDTREHPRAGDGTFADKQHSAPELSLDAAPAPPAFVRVKGCACAVNRDSTVTPMLCPLHADQDPCLTKSLVTGRRREGTIRRGTCTRCGWTERAA